MFASSTHLSQVVPIVVLQYSVEDLETKHSTTVLNLWSELCGINVVQYDLEMILPSLL